MRTATRPSAARPGPVALFALSAALATVAFGTVLAGCALEEAGGSPDEPGKLPTGAAPGSEAPSRPLPPRDRELPDLVGLVLQAAQDKAQTAGFRDLASHDALGRGREQVWDRNWMVCFQSPEPGRRSTKTEIDLGTVKLDERCPPEDREER